MVKVEAEINNPLSCEAKRLIAFRDGIYERQDLASSHGRPFTIMARASDAAEDGRLRLGRASRDRVESSPGGVQSHLPLQLGATTDTVTAEETEYRYQ